MVASHSPEEVQAYIDEEINIALARLDFWEYCLFYDEDFFTRRSFLKEVAEALQWVYEEYLEGRARKISVSMPPRSGKSYICSAFCSWWLGKFPELSVMRNSCTSTLYVKLSYDVRNIVSSDKWRKVFPGLALAKDKQNVDGWNLETAKQVSYFGAGVGGTIIGFGANIAISDDLYKDMADALSSGTQERVAMWKESAHNSRMEKNCPEIFIGTRWTKNDEIGKAQDKGKISKAIKISALTEDGVSFCEDVKSTEEYLAIKEDTDEEIWEAEYGQNPIEIKGLLFPKSGLRYFSPADLASLPTPYKYMPVDPADTGDETAAPTCELYGNGIYVTDALYNNHGTDVTIPDLIEQIVQKRLNKVEIEGVSAWKLFGSQVREKVTERYEDCEIRVLKSVTGNTAKDIRIKQYSAFIKNHFLFLHEDYWTKEYKQFMKDLTSYLRNGSDQKDHPADSLVIAACHFQNNFPNLW